MNENIDLTIKQMEKKRRRNDALVILYSYKDIQIAPTGS